MESLRKLFIKNAKIMWSIKKEGKSYELPIDFKHLDKLNVAPWKQKLIKRCLPSDNVNYSIKDNNIYVMESHGGDDWQQNFMAFTVKVKIGDEYIRVHAGFYLTAMTVFYHLKKNNLLRDDLVLYAYSHGAGASPLLALKIYDAGFAMPKVINFESPRCISRPTHTIKSKCIHFVNFKQGVDVVTTVPWWMSHLGHTFKIKGQKLPWYKSLVKAVFDHDIYWTKQICL